ncbi:hypothetical protein BDV29DRAFT_157471 [Aspergillus leporis]|uniref:Uncharacterized protein n=1 Tax=Aspergillus leporis TaxID=41062 RepID=A0A5N5WYL3_9EURO|nr:hypothetical protein BDV29DRAFT_157471 [Aspergillus leporis]
MQLHGSMFLTFDVMGEGIHIHMDVLGVPSHVPWLLNLIGRIPGAATGYPGFFKWCADEIESKQKSWDKCQDPQDNVSWLLKAFIEKDVSAFPPRSRLPQRQARLDLQQNQANNLHRRHHQRNSLTPAGAHGSLQAFLIGFLQLSWKELGMHRLRIAISTIGKQYNISLAPG